MMKKKMILPLSLILVLLISSMAIAADSNTFNNLGFGQRGPFGIERNGNHSICLQLQALPDQAKAQAAAIREKVQNGELTPAECRAEMEKILPEDWQFQRGPMGKGWNTEISAEVKAQVDVLRAKVKSGEISREECREKMQQLVPQKGQGRQGRGMGIRGQYFQQSF